MPKSEFAANLDGLQARVTAFLKPRGFRKKGRTFNRTTAGGLVQVVNFQMGEYPLGRHRVIAGIRENLYGRFAVNLGVFLPCVHEVTQRLAVPDFVQEHHCTIRDRLGTLAFGGDPWFDLTADSSTLAATLVRLLERFGLPFLERFPDYEAVLAHYQAHGDLPFQNPGRAALEAAIIAHHLGDAERAQALFAKAGSTDHEGFREYVSTIAERLMGGS